MEIKKMGGFFILEHGALYVKQVHPNAVFTTDEYQAMLMFTEGEALAVKNHIEKVFGIV